jgi:CBS domain-containing protein
MSLADQWEQKGQTMTAGELCSGDVVIARPGWSVVEAAERMAEYEVGDLVIIDDDGGGSMTPVGLLTDRDLVIEVLAKAPERLRDVTIGSVMTSEILTAHKDEDLSVVIARMKSEGVRRLPVVNDHGGLEGIISYDDIVEWIGEQMQGLATVARAARSTML